MDFERVVEIFEELEATTKRLEMTDGLSEFFKKAKPSEVRHLVYLLQGQLLPQHEGIELGVGDKLAEQAIALVAGTSVKEVEASYRKTGDLGITARDLVGKKKQHSLGSVVLSAEKVYSNFHRIATAAGQGSQDQKIRLLAELLSNSSALEAKAVLRFVTGRMRLGAGDSTIVDALSVAACGDKAAKPVLERAFNFTSDLGFVAELLFSKGMAAVEAVKPAPFHPIRPALAERLPEARQIVEKLGECVAEAKYDGFRLGIHKQGRRVELYSRRQERVTHMFPDIVSAVAKQVEAREAIFEGEAIGVDAAGNFLPFQETIQRKRKHGVKEKAEEVPLKLFLFELLYCDGKDWTGEPYSARRAALKELLKGGGLIELAENRMVKTPEELEAAFDDFVSRGLEGLVAKDLNAPYVAGARKFAWIKLKRSYSSKLADTVDAVIIGYYLGKGKRTKFGFGGLLTAVLDEENDRFRSIAKIGTGFTEKQMQDLQEMLEKIKLKQKPADVDSLLEADVWVQPKYVVTVTADEITRSPVHTCGMNGKEGFALRFPRLTAIREDKGAKDATTEKEVLELFQMQKQK